jgi:hypothetical protein
MQINNVEIHLQLGNSAGREFEKFWNDEIAAGRMAVDAKAEFRPAVRHPGGLGLTIPPEVIIAFIKGAAEAIGAGVGKLLWEKLKEFFQKPQPQPSLYPQNAKIVIGELVIVFNPNEMDVEPPAPLQKPEA